MGPIAPFLATIQPPSSARAFLLVEKKQRLLCSGRTSSAISPRPYLFIETNSLNIRGYRNKRWKVFAARRIFGLNT
jgi:hypothetical protein